MEGLPAGKAITLMQPTATLPAHGLLRYETRTWTTKHRGLIYIHTAAKSLRVSPHDLDDYVAHRFGEQYRELEYTMSGRSILDVSRRVARNIPASLEEKKEKLRYNELALSAANDLLNEPFEHQDTLNRLKSEYDEVSRSIAA